MSFLKRVGAAVGILAAVVIAAVVIVAGIFTAGKALEALGPVTEMIGGLGKIVANTAAAAAPGIVHGAEAAANTFAKGAEVVGRVAANTGRHHVIGMSHPHNPLIFQNSPPVTPILWVNPGPGFSTSSQPAPALSQQRANIQPVRSPEVVKQLAAIEKDLTNYTRQPGYNPSRPLPIIAPDQNSQNLHRIVCAKLGINASISVARRPDIPVIQTSSIQKQAPQQENPSPPSTDITAPRRGRV